MKKINAGGENMPAEGSRLVIRSSADLSRLAPTVALKDLVRAASGELSLDARVGLMAMKEIARRLEFIANEEEQLSSSIEGSLEAKKLCIKWGLDTKLARAVDVLVEIGNVTYLALDKIEKIADARRASSTEDGHIVDQGSRSDAEFKDLLDTRKISGVQEDKNGGIFVWVDLPTGHGIQMLKMDETRMNILKQSRQYPVFEKLLEQYRLNAEVLRRPRPAASTETSVVPAKVERKPPSFRINPDIARHMRDSGWLPQQRIPRPVESFTDLEKAVLKIRDKLPRGSRMSVSEDKTKLYVKTRDDEEDEVIIDVGSLARASPAGPSFTYKKALSDKQQTELKTIKIPELELHSPVAQEVESREEDKSILEKFWGGLTYVGRLLVPGEPSPSAGARQPARPTESTERVLTDGELDKASLEIKTELDQVAKSIEMLEKPFSEDVVQMLRDLGLDEGERLRASRSVREADIANTLLSIHPRIFGKGGIDSEIKNVSLRDQFSRDYRLVYDAFAGVSRILHDNEEISHIQSGRSEALVNADPAEGIRRRTDYGRIHDIARRADGRIQIPAQNGGFNALTGRAAAIRYPPGFGGISGLALTPLGLQLHPSWNPQRLRLPGQQDLMVRNPLQAPRPVQGVPIQPAEIRRALGAILRRLQPPGR